MRTSQVEAWVLRIVDEVAAGRQVEDDRVELKAQWPDPAKAARRLAGHANSAGSEPILWVIGVDESTGDLRNTDHADAATWWAQVQRSFDEQVSPDPVFLAVPTGRDVTVVALYATTDRAPYVVKNPSGGSPEFEVPVRRGTAVRSAHRSDLLRILVPAVAVPAVEVRDMTLQLMQPRSERASAPPQYRLWTHTHVYLEPRDADTMILPDHRTALEIVGSAGDVLATVAPLTLGVGGVARHLGFKHQPASVLETISRGASQVILQGAGLMTVYTTADSPEPWPLIPGATLTARFAVGVATQPTSSIRFDVPLSPGSSTDDRTIASWQYNLPVTPVE